MEEPKPTELSGAAVVEQLRYWKDKATPICAKVKSLTSSVQFTVIGVVDSTEPGILRPQHGSDGSLQWDRTYISTAVLSVVNPGGRLSLALAFVDGTTIVLEPLYLR